jgi:hypothetical protein
MNSPFVVQSFRQRLLANEFCFVPVRTNDKHPAENKWPQVARTRDVTKAVEWPSVDAMNTGILADGLRALDIDIDDPTIVQRITTIAWQLLGPAPIRTRANSPRCLMLYRASEGEPKKRSKGKVEVLGCGQQFVAQGTHPSGADYQWSYDLGSTRREQLTAVTEDQITAFFNAIEQDVGADAILLPTPAQTTASKPIVTERELACARQALQSECDKLAIMTVGAGRNNALNISAHSIGTLVGAGWIDAQTVARSLFDASVRNGYVAKDGEEVTKRTIESGIRVGMEKPRAPLLDDERTPIDLANPKPDGKQHRAISAPAVAAPRPGLVLTSMNDVQEEAVRWHWPGFLPSGMLTLLSGAGGTGKSTLAFSLAATISTGGYWPDGTRCQRPGNVLIWSSEDDIARTIKPRLMAANADPNRIAFLGGTAGLPFDPANDMPDLRSKLAAMGGGGLALLIIDPIVSAVAGDMNKANDVRRSLQPIVDFAAEFDCAVIGITHFGKNTAGRNTAERVIGSQAFAALARMVWATAKEEATEQRVFTRAKSNISADDGGFHYTIKQVAVHSRNGSMIPTTCVIWGDALEGSARFLLGELEGDDIPQGGKKIDKAKDFLHGILANGSLSVAQVKFEARAAGIAEVTLQRAKEALNIQSIKSKGDFTGGWDWFLPVQWASERASILRQ